jgi:hypothetical protein
MSSLSFFCLFLDPGGLSADRLGVVFLAFGAMFPFCKSSTATVDATFYIGSASAIRAVNLGSFGVFLPGWGFLGADLV